MTFGSDHTAIKRWRALVAWFERTTGLALGAPPPFPSNQCHPPDLRTGWTGLAPSIAAVLAEPVFQSAYRDDTVQGLRELAGHEALATVQGAHRELQRAAQAALAVEADKGWGWRFMVPPEAVKAAKLLASLPDPHSEVTSTGQGDKVLRRLRVDLRGRLVQRLSSIRRPRGKRQSLSARELTALLLLALPDAGGLYELPFSELWTAWRGGVDDPPEKAILGSIHFARLQDAVKQDRLGGRNPTD